MNDTDVDVVASLFSTYYGHLANTVEGWILSAPFYREFVCLGSADTAKREFFACVAVADGVVIGAIFLCFFEDQIPQFLFFSFFSIGYTHG